MYTTESFQKKIQEKFPNVIFLEEYKGSNIKTLFKCLEHDCVFETTPASLLLRKTCCPIKDKETRSKNMARIQTKDVSYFLNKLKEKYGEQIQVKNPQDFVNSYTILTFYCAKHDYEWKTSFREFFNNNNSSCKKCREERRTEILKEQFIESFNKHFIPRGYKVLNLEDFIDYQTVLKFQCDKGHIFEMKPRTLLDLNREDICPICDKLKRSILINYPDKVKYFKNKEDALNISVGSRKDDYIDVVCPFCGYERKMLKRQLLKKEFYCPHCFVSSISYPNKFIRCLLNQFESLDVKYEYFVKDEIFKGRYDAYFELNGEKYAVEMDGYQHASGEFYKDREKDYKERDKLKNEYSLRHNIKIIRVECYFTNFEYIKNNILKSELSKILDFKNINWGKVERDAISEWSIKVCEDFKNGATIKSLVEKYKIGKHTIVSYLIKGTKLGLCNYVTGVTILQNQGYSCYKVYKHEEEIGTFYRLLDILNFLHELGYKIGRDAIRNVAVKGKRSRLLEEYGITIKRIELQKQQ